MNEDKMITRDKQDPSLVRFKAVNSDKTYEEIYNNTILDRIEKENGSSKFQEW